MKKGHGIVLPVLGWIGCLAILVLLVVWLTVELTERRGNAYIAELKKQGEIFDLPMLREKASPEAERRARDFVAVGAELAWEMKLKRFLMMEPPKETPPGKRAIYHQQSLAVSGTISLTWDEVASEVSTLEPILTKIRDIANHGPLEVHSDYALGQAAVVAGAAEVQKAAFALMASGYLEMKKGNSTGATKNIIAALRTIALLSRQRMAVAQILSISLTEMARKATWDLLHSETLSLSNLRELQIEWEQIRPAERIVPALRYERSIGMATFDLPVIKGTLPLFLGTRTFTWSSHNALAASEAYIWGTLFRRSDQRRFLETYQAAIDAAPLNPRGGPWKKSFEMMRTHCRQAENHSVSRMLSLILLMRENFIQLMVASQSQAGLTVTALAIRQYTLVFKRLPSSLEDLTPHFLPEVTRDPFNGDVLRYKKTGDDTYLLYSIGGDFEDSGGQATSRNAAKSKDIVWPEPFPERQ